MTKMQGHLEEEENKRAEEEDTQSVLGFWNAPLGLCSWDETLGSGPDPPTVFPTGIYGQG